METKKIDIAIGRQFPGKVIPLIDNAKKSISVMVYDWRWYPDMIGARVQLFNNAIVRANQRGLDVKAVIWNRGIERILKEAGIKVKWIGQSRLMHVKLIIIDDLISIIGSHNYTKTAFDLNYEASVIIHNQEIAEKFRDFFEDFHS